MYHSSVVTPLDILGPAGPTFCKTKIKIKKSANPISNEITFLITQNIHFSKTLVDPSWVKASVIYLHICFEFLKLNCTKLKTHKTHLMNNSVVT